MADRPVTVFGGSGFLGRRVVERLSAAGIPVRIATRRPQATGGAEALRSTRNAPIEWTRADVQDRASVAAAVAGSRGVVNAVGLYAESGGPTFHSIHVEGARSVALQSQQAGVPVLVHLSGLGADPGSSSLYIRCRGEGEAAVRASFDRPTILRPSVMFGAGDAFLNGLVRAVSLFPVFPLFGLGDTRLQPVWVGDVAAAAASLLDNGRDGRDNGRDGRDGRDRAAVYELGGPRVYLYRELVELVAARLGKRRLLPPIPFGAWTAAAAIGRYLPAFPVSASQVELMRQDNVVGPGQPALSDLNIDPRPLEEVLDGIVGERLASAGRQE